MSRQIGTPIRGAGPQPRPSSSGQGRLEHGKFMCPICWEDLNVNTVVTHCGHMFHSLCLRTWLKGNKSCPNCKGYVNGNMVSKVYPTFPAHDDLNGSNGTRNNGSELDDLKVLNTTLMDDLQTAQERLRIAHCLSQSKDREIALLKNEKAEHEHQIKVLREQNKIVARKHLEEENEVLRLDVENQHLKKYRLKDENQIKVLREQIKIVARDLFWKVNEVPRLSVENVESVDSDIEEIDPPPKATAEKVAKSRNIDKRNKIKSQNVRPDLESDSDKEEIDPPPPKAPAENVAKPRNIGNTKRKFQNVRPDPESDSDIVEISYKRTRN